MANDNIHKGHRERLRKRFAQDGEHFETHELLELLLTYSIPRRDTNRTAHILLSRFGGFDGILSADKEDLTSVEGVGEKTANMFKLIDELRNRPAKANKTDRTVYDSEEKIGTLLVKKYRGKKKEECHIMLFDGRHRMVGFKKMSEGTVNATQMFIRAAVEYAYKNRAVSVVVSHNHPDGIACPTDSDMRFTDGLRTAFRLMGIGFDGHFVVAENDWYLIDGHRMEY